ncbi:MAG: hypothetical protein ACRD8O_04420 [Bryobacteraceae bacterium]
MSGSRSSRAPSIEEVRSGFEQWRQTRQGKTPIPDELWAAAVAVARQDGVNRTAAALHLDGGKLKRRMVTVHSVSGKARPPAFVELTSLATSGLPEYTFEVEGHNGKLRIHCKAASAAELVALSRALWDMAC